MPTWDEATKQQVIEAVIDLPTVANWPEMVDLWQQAVAESRPDWRLPILVAQALGQADSPLVPKVMAAIGCLQLSIILADDLLDDDPRGAQVQWGPGPAANMAVAFQAAAAQLLAEPEAQHILGEIGLATAVGQMASLSPQPDLDAYWQLVTAKSTPFYAGALALGAAVFAPQDEQLRQQMHQLGTLVGELVQIQDDVLDAMMSPANPDWQRPSGNLLLLYGLLTEDEEFANLLAQVQADSTNTSALNQAQTTLIELGAIAYAVEAAKQRQSRFLSLLDDMNLSDKSAMLALVNDQTVRLYQLAEL